MPGKNGYEVAAFVKQHAAAGAHSGRAADRRVRAGRRGPARAVGCDGVLAKPFEPQLVIGRVRELLARGSARAASGARRRRQPAAAAAPANRAADQLDDYFDRLDAAFAKLERVGPDSSDPDACGDAGTGRGAEAESDRSCPNIGKGVLGHVERAHRRSGFDRLRIHRRQFEPSRRGGRRPRRPLSPVEPADVTNPVGRPVSHVMPATEAFARVAGMPSKAQRATVVRAARRAGAPETCRRPADDVIDAVVAKVDRPDGRRADASRRARRCRTPRPRGDRPDQAMPGRGACAGVADPRRRLET